MQLPGAARGWTPLAWVLGGTLTLTIALEMCRRASRPARLMLGLAVGAVLAALLFETLAFFSGVEEAQIKRSLDELHS